MHVAFNKKVISDMSNQVKSPSVVISTDSTNCYDYVAHPFVILTSHHFGVQMNYIFVLLKAIQNMTINLQNGFRVSTSSYSGSVLDLFQGAVQGNGAVHVL